MSPDPSDPSDSIPDSRSAFSAAVPPPADAGPARRARARASLRGLAVGDALGSQFFLPAHQAALRERRTPPGPWQWTDDTEMAASVLSVLTSHGTVDEDALASSFADHHDFDRGYGPAVNRMLRQIRQESGDWRRLAAGLFDGQGSWGNGAAMRVAPLGAWFADDVDQAAEQAERSAIVTHQHPEAVAGAVAVAVMASLVAGEEPTDRSPASLLQAAIARVPRSAVLTGLRRAVDMLDFDDADTVAAVLGCGRRTSAQDTVPFTLWAAARHHTDFVAAFWATAQVGGDVDTTSAIVGGIVASAPEGEPPEHWVAATEALPGWLPGA